MRLSRSMSLVVGSLLLATSWAQAQDGQPARVRGTIAAVEGQTLSVTSREGPVVKIQMAPNVGLRGIKTAAASDIKPGDYVGVASTPASGSQPAGALEV